MTARSEHALRRCTPLAIGAALIVGLAACGSEDAGRRAGSEVATSAEAFSPQRFDASSINVDNQYFPLEPGTDRKSVV